MNIIKQIISKLTRPELLHQDSLGHHWLQVKSTDKDYQYKYQRVKPNKFGKWLLKEEWVSTNNRMQLAPRKLSTV